ncbi:MAG: glycosyltransferase family 1 protein [Patescibacteria group bacterium]
MKILIDIRLLTRGSQGVGEYTLNIVDNLIKSGSEHQWQLFYNGWRKQPLPLSWQKAPNVQIHDWRIPNRIFRWLPIVLDNFIKTDLIFSPHIDFLQTKKTPRILTIHDLSFIHYPNFFSHKHRWWHKMQKVKKQAQRAAHIITDSQFSKNDISNMLEIKPEKISVIYPGIKIPAFAKASAGKQNLKFILYLGTLEPRKNIGAIIKAFNIIKSDPKFSDLKLILAGRIGWLFKPTIQKDVIFLGSVSEEEKNFLYKSASVFVYPSFFEGFGFPPLEAQTRSCPVITSNRSSLPEILKDSAMQINPWRTDHLAKAIKDILINKKLKNKLIKSGQENIKRFTWEQCADQLLKIFLSYS